MPQKLDGKPLTPAEHRIWLAAHKAATRSGAASPGAVATYAVQKHRANRAPRKRA